MLRFTALAAALVLAVCWSRPAVAQRAPPELVIRVVDEATDAPVPSARVEISGKRRAGLTSDSGTIHIEGLEARKHLVGILRVGYRYEQFIADMTPGGVLAVDIELHPSAVAVEGVTATGTRERRALRDVGYYERARQGFASVLDRAKIEEERPIATLDLFRGMRGFRVAYSGGGGGTTPDVKLFSSRGSVSLAPTNDTCVPDLFLDGVRVPTSDIEFIRPESIDAIEAYPGVGGVPLRFSVYPNPCGSVFIWTRHGP